MPEPSDLAPPPNRAAATDEPWAGVGDVTLASLLPDASVYPPPWGCAALPPRPATTRAGTTALEPSSLLGGVGLAGLDVTEWTMSSSVILSIAGEVDIATAAELSEALGTALGSDVKRLVCDLSGVGFLGAAGLTSLLWGYRHAIACRAQFDLAGLQPLPRRVIALVRLDSVFALHDSVAEAVDAQTQRAAPFELTRSRTPTDLRASPRGQQLGGRYRTQLTGPEGTNDPVALTERGALSGRVSVSKDPKSSQTAVLVDLVCT